MAKKEKSALGEAVSLVLIALAIGGVVILISKNKGKNIGDVIKDAINPGGSEADEYPASEGWAFTEGVDGKRYYYKPNPIVGKTESGYDLYETPSGLSYYQGADGRTYWEDGTVSEG